MRGGSRITPVPLSVSEHAIRSTDWDHNEVSMINNLVMICNKDRQTDGLKYDGVLRGMIYARLILSSIARKSHKSEREVSHRFN